MSTDLTLYSNPMSRGRIARWMLEEIGAPYQVKYLEYGTTMKDKEYLSWNPMGKVPALQHGDTVVTEAAAICAYLADAFPAAGLAPPMDQRASYYRWLFFAAGPIEAAVTIRSLNMDIPADKQGTVGFGNYERMLDTLEYACRQSDFLAGDTFSAADVYVGAQIGFGFQFGTLEKRPAMEKYWDQVSDRDAYKRASELDNAAMAAQAPG
ncbi:MAG: glutathione S-transferase family protein [Granulosicoccus sp.]